MNDDTIRWPQDRRDCRDCQMEWLGGRQAASGDPNGPLTFLPCGRHNAIPCGCVLYEIDRGRADFAPCRKHVELLFASSNLTLDLSTGPPRHWPCRTQMLVRARRQTAGARHDRLGLESTQRPASARGRPCGPPDALGEPVPNGVGIYAIASHRVLPSLLAAQTIPHRQSPAGISRQGAGLLVRAKAMPRRCSGQGGRRRRTMRLNIDARTLALMSGV